MKDLTDLSIGQRLAIGLAAILVVFAVVNVLVFRTHQESVAAQEAFTERVHPRLDAAAHVHTSFLDLAIAARRCVIVPEPRRLERYRKSIRQLEHDARRLSGVAAGTEAEGAVERIARLTRDYLSEIARLVNLRLAGEPLADQETLVDATRQAALAALAEFGEAQDEAAAAALAIVTATRARSQRTLFVGTAAAIVLWVFLAVVVARAVTVPARSLLRVASQLEAGAFTEALALAPPRDGPRPHRARSEFIQLARGFRAAAAALQRREQRLEANRLVASAAAASLSKEVIADAALQAIREFVRAEVGVLYWSDADPTRFVPIARHGVNGRLDSIAAGEGIPGQAAKDGRSIVVRDIPRDTPFAVRLGYDQAPPRSVAAVPIVVGEQVRGVLLVASLRELDDEAESFLHGVRLQLGVGLANARAYEEIAEKGQQIQAQNEELQAQNEEIQAQSEELQAQTEELQVQNQELHERGETLHEQRSALEEADRRKNEFLALLAHELRNPMAPIMNALFVLKEAPAGSDEHRRAEAILSRQVAHLIRLIDDLLDVTRISRGKIHIRRDVLDLRETLRTCVEDQVAACEAAGLRLDVRAPADPVWVDGDHTRLCQVIQNLLTNAIKFTPAGGSIRLALEAPADEGLAAIRVIDDGLGIEPGFVDRLFQPFSQAADGLARANGGLGLGLALVKALVELHGGRVEAQSDGPGAGAEFVVWLPLAAPPPDVEARVPAGADARARATRARRILVVDDNRDAADSLRDALELEGHDVKVVYSAPAALDTGKTFRPDVVLCDIGLPGMSGYELARRLRDETGPDATVLVALTGYASPQDRDRATAAGFQHHLAKPARIEHLAAILAQAGSDDGPTSC